MKKLYPLDIATTYFDIDFILTINKIIINQNEIIEWISQFQDRIKKATEQDKKIKEEGSKK